MSRILANGITQSILVDLLATIRTNWNGILAKLDGDGGITDTDYHSLYNLTLPSGIQTTGVKAIMHQGEVVAFLEDFVDEYNLTLTKLDADTGITDTDYSSTLAITDIVGNAKVDGIIPTGVYQENKVWLLNHAIARIAALTAKLDGDAGITDTNYAATWDIADTVVEEFSRSRPRISGAGGILFALALGFSSMATARPIVEGDVISLQGAATHYVVPVDVGRLERFSLHATYSAAAPASFNFTDGRPSTAQITVATASNTIAGSASATITVATTGISGAIVTIHNWPFTEGRDWYAASLATTTAESLKTAINAFPSLTATRADAVVTVSATQTGTHANTWVATSTVHASLACSAATLTGGRNHASVTINGVTLTQGTDWTTVATASMTAIAIKNAINANASLSPIVVASTAGAASVVYATSTTNAVNRYLLDVNGSGLTISGHAFLNGAATDVNLTTDIIGKVGHGLTEAMAVLLSSSAGTPPTGLTHGVTYYVIPVNKDQIQLSTGTTEALDGLEVNMTAVTGGGTFTLAPLAFAGTPSFRWQASNNGTDWFSLNVTSITWSAASNTLWEWTAPTFKWIRLNLLGPTSGGLKLGVRLHGREN